MRDEMAGQDKGHCDDLGAFAYIFWRRRALSSRPRISIEQFWSDHQARHQEGWRVFGEGPKIFWTMSNTFFQEGGRKIF